MIVWDQFLSHLEGELGRETVEKWIKTLKLVRFDAANVYLEAKDSFQISWFEEHVRPLCSRLVNNNNRKIQVHLASSAPPKNSLKEQKITASSFIAPDPLDPEMTLENFINTPANAMACNLISDIAYPFNPIFLYGPPGCGKTHLLMAAAAILRKKGHNVFYVRAENFTEHVVQAIRKSLLTELRSAYRSSDALIIDDIHIFSRKSATQEEFFHTFNELHTRGSPILLSSQCPPSKLIEIEPRLVSRFEWGITASLEKGDWASILAKKAELWKLKFDPSLIPFLIEKFPSSPVLPLQALAFRTNNAPLDAKLASNLLKDLLKNEEINAWNPEKIIKAISAHYGICTEDVLGKSQTREAAVPRQVAMYLCRQTLKLPFQKIGEIFSRDHSTVMSSVRQVQKEIDKKNPDFCKAAACIN